MYIHRYRGREFLPRLLVVCLILGQSGVSDARAQTLSPKDIYLTQLFKLSVIKDGSENIASAQETGRDQRGAEADDYASRNLVAQESMVTWTKFSCFATLAGVILSGGGLLALLYSLRLNRRATDAAQNAVSVTRETNEAQNRAWVSVTCQLGKPQIGKTHEGVEGIYFAVTCHTKNHGCSPATSVSFHAEIALLGPGRLSTEDRMLQYCDAIRKRPEHEAEAIFPEAHNELGHMVFLPISEIEAATAGKDFRMIAPIVYGCLNYKSPYTKGVRQTRFVYNVASVNESGQVVVLMPDKLNWLDLPIHLTAPGTIIAD